MMISWKNGFAVNTILNKGKPHKYAHADRKNSNMTYMAWKVDGDLFHYILFNDSRYDEATGKFPDFTVAWH